MNSSQINLEKTVRCNTIQGFKDYISQTLTTQAWKGAVLVRMMFFLEQKIGFHDEKWLEESKAHFLKEVKEIYDEKKAAIIMTKRKKQLFKQGK